MARKQEPGKYEAILAMRNPDGSPRIPKLPPNPDDLAKQEKVDLVKANITDRNPRLLANAYITYREKKDKLLAELAANEVYLDAYEQMLEESKDAHAEGWGQYGVKENTLRLASGATIRVHSEPYGLVKDRDAFRRWCIANDYERQLTLHASRVNSIVKEHLVAGKPEPDGCTTFAKTTIYYSPRGE